MSEDSYNVHAKSFFTAKVKEVIYDGTNPQYERWGGYDSRRRRRVNIRGVSSTDRTVAF